MKESVGWGSYNRAFGEIGVVIIGDLEILCGKRKKGIIQIVHGRSKGLSGPDG